MKCFFFRLFRAKSPTLLQEERDWWRFWNFGWEVGPIHVFNPSTTLKLHGASNKTDTVFLATRIRSWKFQDFLTNPQAGLWMEPLLGLNCFSKTDFRVAQFKGGKNGEQTGQTARTVLCLGPSGKIPILQKIRRSLQLSQCLKCSGNWLPDLYP